MAGDKVKIYIIYYSAWGHIAKLAKQEKEGVDSVPGCEGILFQVKETLPQEVQEKMHIPPQDSEIPFIDAKSLPDADGYIFGYPTRFGNAPVQFLTLWQATGQLWQAGTLAGKPFSIFTATASQGGGQEVTHLNSLSNFVHHAMIYVPTGYTFGPEMFPNDQLRGGTAWGASTFSNGDGSRQPTQIELDQAKHQGKYVAEIYKKIAGKA